jgi:hypothetical protein
MTAATATAPNANSLLMGGGVTGAKFDTIGTTVGGRIVREPVTKQQTDFDSGEPKFYADGNPMWQITVQVQTDQRKPDDATDDGVRAIYLKGQLMQAVREAVKVASAPGLEEGGELYVTFVREEPNSRGRGNDKKVYSAHYKKPLSAANEALMGTPTATAAVDPNMPTNVDKAVWDRLDANQRAAVIAASPASNTPPF